MSIRPRSARALRDVRERLRDVAAASHACAVVAHDHTRRRVAEEEQRLAEFFDDAHAALAAARTVHDLDRIADHHTEHRLVLATASAEAETAEVAVRDSQLKLRDSARDLRIAERTLDRIELQLVRDEARAEQRANDDLVGKRKP